MKTKIKKALSVLMAVCLLLSVCVGSAYADHLMFADSVGHWAEDAINQLARQGDLAGYPDGLVRPDEIITRCEFVALVARTAELTAPEEDGNVTIVFTDIMAHWAQKDIEALIAAGIIQKDDYDDQFQPDAPISRMEMIRMLVRAIGKGEHPANCKCNIEFVDLDGLTDGEKQLICTAKQYHIICGYPDGTIRPDGEATRAEAIEMIVNKDKADEQIKQEEAQKTPAVKPEDKSSGSSSGGSGGGSSYEPTPQYGFTLPKTAYTGEEITIKSDSRYVNGVTWTALKNGLPAELSAVLEGELKNEGGKLKFKEPGSFTLIATAQNSQGVTVTCEQTISVYSVVTAHFSLPEAVHTDTAVVVDLTAENLGANEVAWSLTRDGKEADIKTALTGQLTTSGGTVLFVEQGVYTLTASIMDEPGKTITAEDSVTVYPVAEVKLTLPTVSHTDKTITLKTETKEAEGLEAAWSLTRNGEAVEISDFIEGELTGGDVRFKEKGVYALTLSLTDKTGRRFTNTVNIAIYPVGSAGFYLPEVFHTDSTVMVEAVFGEIGSHTATWSLTLDGKEVTVADATEGNLTNGGGTLQFPAKGSYVLKAEFTDDGGRNYSYEQAFKVYPVPTVRYVQPEYAHTDSKITVDAVTTGLDGLSIEWLVDNTFGFQDCPTYVEGALTDEGGVIRFKRAGVYELVARVTDKTGRVFLFEPGNRTEVLPVLEIGFTLPRLAYTDTAVDLRTHGNNNVLPVEWSITKDGKSIPLARAIDGTLNAQGGKFTFLSYGEYVLTATMTDYLKRSYSHSQSIDVLPVVEFTFAMPQTVHYGAEFSVSAKDVQHLGSNDVVWTLQKDGNAAPYTGTLDSEGGKIAIHDMGTFTLTATVTDRAGRMATHSESIDVTNTAPNMPTLSAQPTRTVKDGKFLVNVSAEATDPDGDTVTLEYDGTTADSYYAVGSHTIRVRAKDSTGVYSAWTEKTFTIANSAPTTPVISRSPSGNSVPPGTSVTITAASTDADGDAITYVWEGRNAQTQTYPLGKNVVRVKAMDVTGAESPWAAIVFFVASANGEGGMTLTGPDSIILENGLEGATITEYTFTVPPVSGHNGNDFGRVRGYNVLTGQWDQLSYDTTTNGITFTKTLDSGIYSKLEFYYYTNHNCMYNKSNITYSVNYHFE